MSRRTSSATAPRIRAVMVSETASPILGAIPSDSWPLSASTSELTEPPRCVKSKVFGRSPSTEQTATHLIETGVKPPKP